MNTENRSFWTSLGMAIGSVLKIAAVAWIVVRIAGQPTCRIVLDLNSAVFVTVVALYWLHRAIKRS